ncbi:MAG TPA: hypothetical protein VHS53_07455 [Mucilaginibacter sp.]|nr:hypothetical protein [Mucilaginibacter sp.]
MKELNDEELQRLIEDGYFSSNEPLNEDVKAYKTLFEALGKEPEIGLSYDFAAKVTRHIQAEQKRGNELRSNLMVAGLFLAAMSMSCCALAIFNPDTTSDLLKYKWILLLVPVAFMAIQYFDQKLVKTRIFDNRSYKP